MFRYFKTCFTGCMAKNPIKTVPVRTQKIRPVPTRQTWLKNPIKTAPAARIGKHLAKNLVSQKTPVQPDRVIPRTMITMVSLRRTRNEPKDQ